MEKATRSIGRNENERIAENTITNRERNNKASPTKYCIYKQGGIEPVAYRDQAAAEGRISLKRSNKYILYVSSTRALRESSLLSVMQIRVSQDKPRLAHSRNVVIIVIQGTLEKGKSKDASLINENGGLKHLPY